MSDIDPVSKLLGRFEQDMETNQRQRATLFDMVGDIKTSQAETAADIKASMAKISEAVAVMLSQQNAHVAEDTMRFTVGERRMDRIEGKVGGIDTKLAGMELTGAKKAGLVAALGAAGLFISGITAALARLWP